jgi:hypothetical protein
MSYWHSLRARAARAGLHRPVGWLRNFGLDSNDVVLPSYGRAGSTLQRFVLAEILGGVPATFDNIQRLAPEMGLQFNTYPILPSGGRLIKTHEPYCREYKRGIYLIRDIRDVILSAFARETGVGCIHPKYAKLDDYIEPFLEGKLLHWGTWRNHVESWMNSPPAQSGDLLVFRFEDMRKDLEGTFVRTLEFLGARVDRSVIQAAIRNNSIESMRAKEDHSALQQIAGEGRHVNSGEIGRWKSKLTERNLRLIDDYVGDVLDRFGYPRGAAVLAGKEHNAMPWDASKIGISEPRDFNPGVARPISPVNFNGVHPCASRSLRVRLGGRIANTFCWYPY